MRFIAKKAVSSALSAALLAASLGNGAAANVAKIAGGAGWTPPFAPASQAFFSGLQRFVGYSTIIEARSPALRAVAGWSPSPSESGLRVIGALSARLPGDFGERMARAVAGPGDEREMRALSDALAEAYSLAAVDAATAAGERARQILAELASGAMSRQDLVRAAAQLGQLDVFGPLAQEQTRLVRQAAAAETLEKARAIAASLAGRGPSLDADGGHSEGFVQAGPESKKPIPDSWKLQPSGKAKEGASAASPQEEADSAPKPDPWSADFYERLGAGKEMTAKQIKSAFYLASRLYHPDMHQGKGAAVVAKMTKAFQNILQAYETLGNPVKRRTYDLAKKEEKKEEKPRPAWAREESFDSRSWARQPGEAAGARQRDPDEESEEPRRAAEPNYPAWERFVDNAALFVGGGLALGAAALLMTTPFVVVMGGLALWAKVAAPLALATLILIPAFMPFVDRRMVSHLSDFLAGGLGVIAVAAVAAGAAALLAPVLSFANVFAAFFTLACLAAFAWGALIVLADVNPIATWKGWRFDQWWKKTH